MEQKPYDIRERAFVFAKDTVSFCRRISGHDHIMRRLSWQLVDAAGSIGANLEEADEGQTKPDFIAKNYNALKECKEARLWLRLIAEAEPRFEPPATPLIQEALELTRIVRAIVIKAKRSNNRG